MIIELSIPEAHREKFKAPEWVQLDTDRLLETPAKMLIRWETETQYAIERALGEILGGNPPSAAVLVMLWVARKQMGVDGGGVDEETGKPEPYARLADVPTLKVGIRRARDVEPEPSEGADAIPPASTPEP